MTLKTNVNRQSNGAFSRTGQSVAGRARRLAPGLRRAAHLPGDFPAGAILVPPSGDVNRNLETPAGDFAGLNPDIHANALFPGGGAVVLTNPNNWSEAGIVAALDDEDEEEDEDDYDDDELDEEDDEDLDEEEDAEFDDEDELDDDDDLDDDDLDDEDEEDDEE